MLESLAGSPADGLAWGERARSADARCTDFFDNFLLAGLRAVSASGFAKMPFANGHSLCNMHCLLFTDRWLLIDLIAGLPCCGKESEGYTDNGLASFRT